MGDIQYRIGLAAAMPWLAQSFLDFVLRDTYYDEKACSMPRVIRHKCYLRRIIRYTANSGTCPIQVAVSWT
jgi:hypothetical protein